MNDIQQTLNSRINTHGDYSNTARIIQSLKFIVLKELQRRNQRGQQALQYTQHEAIDMIMHKIGRIISGDPNTADHWHDIAGYARLCENELVVTTATEPVVNQEFAKVT